ncbi:hypothetical protein GCM10022254_19760 [Actinomadura meridiana]|uniref:Uncharacterized protein n=1 Tax=Actinomadura meridiana TaxID=559626 RepID=A0ABP8BWQ5_9ACTN
MWRAAGTARTHGGRVREDEVRAGRLIPACTTAPGAVNARRPEKGCSSGEGCSVSVPVTTPTWSRRVVGCLSYRIGGRVAPSARIRPPGCEKTQDDGAMTSRRL